MNPPTTEEWARSHGISTALTPPAIEDYDESCPLTARQIAMRAIVLHCVVAVASGVDASPVVALLQEQQLWEDTSPRERSFLLSPKSLDQKTRSNVGSHKEAQCTLRKGISKVES